MASDIRENYIKALWYLHQKNEDISLSDLGELLEVSKPSANDMVKKLQKEGIVKSEKYKPIKITDKGRIKAAQIIRKHRLSEMFLLKIMGFGWEEVHDIAEELEHITSVKFFDRMDEILGYPTVDPHGSAIPDTMGNFKRPEYIRLSQCPVDATVKVTALRDSSSDFLLFLNKKSIQLQTVLHILDKEHFDGSMTLSYERHPKQVLSLSVCDRILVEKI